MKSSQSKVSNAASIAAGSNSFDVDYARRESKAWQLCVKFSEANPIGTKMVWEPQPGNQRAVTIRTVATVIANRVKVSIEEDRSLVDISELRDVPTSNP